MNAAFRWLAPIAAASFLVTGAAQARAGLILPTVVASIHDEPIDGIGDSFNGVPFQGLLRRVTTVPFSRDDRAIVEFNLTPFAGPDLTQATLSLSIDTNNFGGASFREYDVLLYAGNGVADLSDFSVASTFIQRVGYNINNTPSRGTFNLDVLAQLRPLLNSGSNFVGVRLDPIGTDNFPSILIDSSLDVQAVPEPPSALLLGVGVACLIGHGHAAWRPGLVGRNVLNNGRGDVGYVWYFLLDGGRPATVPPMPRAPRLDAPGVPLAEGGQAPRHGVGIGCRAIFRDGLDRA